MCRVPTLPVNPGNPY